MNDENEETCPVCDGVNIVYEDGENSWHCDDCGERWVEDDEAFSEYLEGEGDEF